MPSAATPFSKCRTVLGHLLGVVLDGERTGADVAEGVGHIPRRPTDVEHRGPVELAVAGDLGHGVVGQQPVEGLRIGSLVAEGLEEGQRPSDPVHPGHSFR
jgi:hypothetical protein